MNENLRAGIIQAINQANALEAAAKNDKTVSQDVSMAMAEAWGAVARALVNSPTPDPAMPGSEATWAQRKMVVQAMVDAIRAAEASVRTATAPDVCQKLQAQLAELQAKLDAGGEKVTTEINFGGRPAPDMLGRSREAFAEESARLVASTKRGERDFAAGQADAGRRS